VKPEPEPVAVVAGAGKLNWKPPADSGFSGASAFGAAPKLKPLVVVAVVEVLACAGNQNL